MTPQVTRVLIDAGFMIQNEIQYITTGKAPGPSMRDNIGQWKSLLRDIKALLKEESL